MTARSGTVLAVIAALGTFVASACSDHVYVVEIFVKANVQAQQGRRIRAGRRDMPPFDPTSTTSVQLCTPSASKFYAAAIPMVVSDDKGVVSTATLTPMACALAQPRGSIELDTLYLEDDGTLLTDLTGGDTRVFANCVEFQAGETCKDGDDL
jgi:hypothetical protein